MRLTNLSKIAAFSAIISLSTITNIQSSQAQFSIQLGGDEGQLHALLSSRGYDRIETLKLSITHSRFNACKGSTRYNLDVKWTGEIDKKVIGKCRSLVNVDSITQTLTRLGYERINIQNSQGQYTAVACSRGNRYRIGINVVGDVISESRIGRCQNTLNSTDLITALREQNYNRIQFTDLNPPRYKATACRGGKKYELTLNQFGDVRRRNSIGQCLSQIKPKDIAKTLKKRGFTQVQVIDKRLPLICVQTKIL